MGSDRSGACLKFQYVYSTLLLLFCTAIIFGLIFTEQTRLAEEVHPAVAFIVLIVAVTWLTMVEGGQGAIVGLTPVDPELYKESHPRAYQCTAIAHKGDNLDRYLLGRQFMVILIVFSVNMAGEATEHAELWGFPSWLVNALLTSGVAMILFTNMVGQLNSEINACHCMLDYLNNFFGLFTVWVAMAIEFSGLLHTSYLVQLLVTNLAGQPIESNEEKRSIPMQVFFWGRCAFSLGVLGFSLAVTLKALFDGQTKMWDFIHPGVSVIIFIVLLCVVGVLEAMQIAYFAITKLQESERGTSIFARKTCKLLFENHGRGLAAFMIGRQLMVVSCMFFIARITSVVIAEGQGNIFGVRDGVQNLFNTGLLGALVVAIVGSISWRLVASAFPLFFVNNPIVFVFLKICLFLEMTGVCSGAWVLAAIHKKLAGFQRDEVYIGTAEERAARGHADADDAASVHSGAGHLFNPTMPAPAPKTLDELMQLEKELQQQQQDIDNRIEAVRADKLKLMKANDEEEATDYEHNLELKSSHSA